MVSELTPPTHHHPPPPHTASAHTKEAKQFIDPSLWSPLASVTTFAKKKQKKHKGQKPLDLTMRVNTKTKQKNLYACNKRNRRDAPSLVNMKTITCSSVGEQNKSLRGYK